MPFQRKILIFVLAAFLICPHSSFAYEMNREDFEKSKCTFILVGTIFVFFSFPFFLSKKFPCPGEICPDLQVGKSADLEFCPLEKKECITGIVLIREKKCQNIIDISSILNSSNFLESALPLQEEKYSFLNISEFFEENRDYFRCDTKSRNHFDEIMDHYFLPGSLFIVGFLFIAGGLKCIFCEEL